MLSISITFSSEGYNYQNMGLHPQSVDKNIIKPYQVSDMYQVGRGGAYLLLLSGQNN